jgi:hypothetical protein
MDVGGEWMEVGENAPRRRAAGRLLRSVDPSAGAAPAASALVRPPSPSHKESPSLTRWLHTKYQQKPPGLPYFRLPATLIGQELKSNVRSGFCCLTAPRVRCLTVGSLVRCWNPAVAFAPRSCWNLMIACFCHIAPGAKTVASGAPEHTCGACGCEPPLPRELVNAAVLAPWARRSSRIALRMRAYIVYCARGARGAPYLTIRA